jgi:hypothetical protein
MLKSSEKISHLISRYAIFEHLYMGQTSAAHGELEAVLIGIYGQILIFLARAKQQFETSLVGQTQWSIYPLLLAASHTSSPSIQKCLSLRRR